MNIPFAIALWKLIRYIILKIIAHKYYIEIILQKSHFLQYKFSMEEMA